MHKVNSLRQRRIERKQGLPKSKQTYRGAIKNFAGLSVEEIAKEVVQEIKVSKEKPKKKYKKKTKTKKEA
tara:strand:+ start:895 stop:1104 length:210 start_codon:yes stop_codon:yes gene_type:complete